MSKISLDGSEWDGFLQDAYGAYCKTISDRGWLPPSSWENLNDTQRAAFRSFAEHVLDAWQSL